MAIPAAPAILDGLATPVARTFEVTRTLPNGIDRVLNGSSIVEPTTLTVRHTSFPAKGTKAAYDRRSVSCQFIKLDSAGVPQTSTFSGTLVVSRSSVFTVAMLDDMNAFVRNFWSSYKSDLYLGKS